MWPCEHLPVCLGLMWFLSLTFCLVSLLLITSLVITDTTGCWIPAHSSESEGLRMMRVCFRLYFFCEMFQQLFYIQDSLKLFRRQNKSLSVSRFDHLLLCLIYSFSEKDSSVSRLNWQNFNSHVHEQFSHTRHVSLGGVFAGLNKYSRYTVRINTEVFRSTGEANSTGRNLDKILLLSCLLIRVRLWQSVTNIPGPTHKPNSGLLDQFNKRHTDHGQDHGWRNEYTLFWLRYTPYTCSYPGLHHCSSRWKRDSRAVTLWAWSSFTQTDKRFPTCLWDWNSCLCNLQPVFLMSHNQPKTLTQLLSC